MFSCNVGISTFYQLKLTFFFGLYSFHGLRSSISLWEEATANSYHLVPDLSQLCQNPCTWASSFALFSASASQLSGVESSRRRKCRQTKKLLIFFHLTHWAQGVAFNLNICVCVFIFMARPLMQ